MKTAPTSGAVIMVTLLALAGCAATGGGADPKAIVGPDKIVHHINVTGAQGMDFLFDGRCLARAEGRRCARCA